MASLKLSALSSLGPNQVPTDLLYIDDLSAGAAGSKSITPNDLVSTITRNITDGAVRFQGFAAPALSGAGQGAIYFDSTANAFRVSENAGAYRALGDVAGPAGATANGLARYNGTTGKLIKDSLVTVSDLGAFANALIQASSNVLGAVTMTLSGDATGDVYYRNAGGLLTRLGIGTAAQVLTVAAGLPSWATPASAVPGGANTQVQYNNAGAFGGVSGATSNGTAITFTADNLIATSPHFITSIDDSNGNPLFLLTAVGSSINQFTVANAATGAGPTLSATGGDTNIPINVSPKGSGVFNSTGPLRLSGSIVDQFVTPIGNSIPTKINIPLFDPGGFGQVLAMGLAGGIAASARVITVCDQRAAGHQPSIALLSPDESQIFGLSWDGDNTAGFLINTTGLLGFQGTDAYFGNGVVNAAPASYVLNGTGGSGTNIAGANLDLAGGKATGNAIPGIIGVRYPLIGATGTTLQSLSAARFPVQTNFYLNYSTTTTVANTAAETGLLGAADFGTDTIQAGLGRVGRAFRLDFRGVLQNTGTPTLTIRIKLGGTTLAAYTGTMVAVSGQVIWKLSILAIITAIGVAGNLSIKPSVFEYSTIATGAAQWLGSNVTDTAIDFTANQQWSLTIQWGTANPANSFTYQFGNIDILR